jgi:DNA polymerase-3 subunit alpha
VNAADISPELIGKIEDVCKEFKGNVPLYLKLSDTSENMHLELLSRKFRICPVNDMVRKMRKVADVDVVF